jgi:hypothetical protein
VCARVRVCSCSGFQSWRFARSADRGLLELTFLFVVNVRDHALLTLSSMTWSMRASHHLPLASFQEQ